MKHKVMAMALAAVALPLCAGCTVAGSTEALPEGAYVLSGKQAESLLQQCSRGTPAKGEATFRPDNADIAALEAALAGAVANRESYAPNIGARAVPMPGQPDFSRVPQGWKRQYAGLVRGGRRYIYGNYFPDADFADDARPSPADTAVVVCDGGPAFFGAEWDVEARKFTHLAFNGSV